MAPTAPVKAGELGKLGVETPPEEATRPVAREALPRLKGAVTPADGGGLVYVPVAVELTPGMLVPVISSMSESVVYFA